MDIASFITSLSIPALGFNWIDVVIIFVITFYAIEGYSLGFFTSLIDFISFVLSFVLGITFYSRVAYFLVNFFDITQGFANAAGFFIVAAFFIMLFNILLKDLLLAVPLFTKDPKKTFLKEINKLLGTMPGILSGLLLCSFILSLVITLPFSVFLKRSVSNAKIGNMLVASTQVFAKSWGDVFGGAINDTLSFLTVEPKGNQTVDLNFKTSKTDIDYSAEQKMFNMVNNERQIVNLGTLSFSESLAKVARAHCEDMFSRGYFSHYTPERLSPFDRIAEANIDFNYAGENLALAPNVELAMKGLMQSPGHKANILTPKFNEVGIGVIDGGIYGQMYCQEFTD